MRKGVLFFMRRNANHDFSKAPQATIPRSTFLRTHDHKTTFDAGYLVPFYWDEVLPGDTFNVKTTGFARLATPIYPIMDNLHMETFFFAIPLRLLWTNFQKFMGEQTNPGDSTDFLVPQVPAPAGGWASNSLADYYGLPTGLAGYSVNALFFRAYNLVYNEWFRDENLQNSVPVSKGDGPDLPADYVLLRRGKRHDYFTSALPFAQKGTAVQVPLGSSAPILGLGVQNNTNYPSAGVTVRESDGTTSTYATAKIINNSGVELAYIEQNGVTGYPNVRADLSLATAATVNQVRLAFQIQKLLERDARGGTRYTEIIVSHFGVHSPDARLQRPEYLGGGYQMVNINPVAQTSSTDATTPQGNLSAFGTCTFTNHGFVKSFTEHCIILGLVSVRADITYQQGINRAFSRRTKYDFYWPALSHVGEQAILNKEIYAQATAVDDQVFGYQERYAEYRYKPSMVTGLFRTSAAGTLDSWHLAQSFSSLPVLNTTFIQETPPMARVKAVTTEPDFIADFHIYIKCARPMPMYGVPGLIDHF